MAIVTDPDLCARESVIFGTKTQKVSVYPIDTLTQRGDATGEFANDAWVSNTSNITRESGVWTGVVNGDVVCILQGPDAGHYYVNNNISTTSIDLTRIIDGTSGATTSTGLTVSDFTAQNANVHSGNNSLEITAHGYTTGDCFVLDNATPPSGLTDNTPYYIIVNDANFIRLATTYDNALANTDAPFTTAGTGDTDFHERVPVTVFNNGASTSEQISGATTSGDGTGDLADGVTLQAVYSYGKEQWRDDEIETGSSNTNYNDDLIRHQFPYEAITSEQFEIGGGAAHDDWGWFDIYSRKKIRTGGWAEKTTVSATNDLERQTGIITLGSLDTDTQVYYQQTSATTAPTNFTFLGTINEAIQIYLDTNQDGSADNDFTTYLKLFARKKGKTYVQSEIADIGVTTIQTIVNRFPLAHATDTAITSTDGQILGTSPYRAVANIALTGDLTDGDTVTGELTFDDPDAAFDTDDVVIGDTLEITSGSDIGSYTISAVTDANTLTIGSDFEFSGWTGTSSAVDYEIHTSYRVADKTTATPAVYSTGEMTTSSNVFSDTTEQHFITSAVAANDILHIQESGVNYGIYKITAVDDANTITVDDTDQPLITNPTTDYMIRVAGMYLQYKKTVSAASPYIGTTTAFDDDDAAYGNRPTITLTGDTWDADVVAGTILEITGSENSGENDGSYTVFAQETSAIVSLVPTDVLTLNADDTTASIAAYNGFKRDIGGTTYGFNWKVTGNDGGLSDVYQFVQHQLRQTTDIDFGEGTSRGDITDLLMSYASPTGTTINMYIDDLNANDLNNITMQDHSGVNRNFPFTAAGSLTFNTNLQGDTNAKYWLFFTNDDAGDNLGRDYGTEFAIIVEDKDAVPIQGDVSAAASISFTYDFDQNTQRGDASAGANADVTLVAIGLETAQFVVSTATITRATGITISAVAALERNYLNP